MPRLEVNLLIVNSDEPGHEWLSYVRIETVRDMAIRSRMRRNTTLARAASIPPK